MAIGAEVLSCLVAVVLGYGWTAAATVVLFAGLFCDLNQEKQENLGQGPLLPLLLLLLLLLNESVAC